MKKPTSPSLMAQRQARLTALRQYRAVQSKIDGTTNLGDVIDWLSKLDGQGARSIETDSSRMTRAISELRDAVFAGLLGGDEIHPIIMVAEDQEPCRFTAEDIATAKRRKDNDPSKPNIYDDPNSAEELLKRLWVSRSLVADHFRTNNWPLPHWLSDAPPANVMRRLTTKGNKSAAIEAAIRTLFPTGVPVQMSAQQRNDAIWAALSNMKPLPDKRTIERVLEKIGKE